MNIGHQNGHGLISGRKRGIPPDYIPPPIEPELCEGEEIVANVVGMEIAIREPMHALRVYSMGNFGTFVGQRMNFPNLKCFQPSPSSTMDDGKTEPAAILQNSTKNEENGEEEERRTRAMAWIEKNTGGGWLHLSPVEAFYLFHELGKIKLVGFAILPSGADDLFNLFKSTFGSAFVRRYQIYRYFRRLGWIVRDGLNFGTEYLLYKDGVEINHACAGVRIIESMGDPIVNCSAIHATLRELNNCKKRLLLAAVDFHLPMDKLRLGDLEAANVHILLMDRWNLHRPDI